MKKKALFIVKGILSLVLLGLLARQSEWDNLKTEFGKIEIGYFIAAIGLYLVSIVISSFRLRLLVRDEIPVKRLFSFYLIGGFFNNFLPTMMGGDVVKAYYLYRETKRGGASLAAVFMDRYVGFVGLLLMVLVAYLSGWSRIANTPIVWVIPAVVVGFILGSILLWKMRWDLFRQLKRLYVPLMEYKKYDFGLGKTVAYSIVIQFLAILAVQILARGMGIRIAWFFFYIFVPLTVVITMVPISVSGFGIREGAMVYLFGFAGVENAAALSLSLIWYGSVMVANLLGGVEYVRLGHVDKKELRDLE